MADVKRGQLVKAAEELNKVLEPSPPINPKAKAPQLTKKCKEAAELIHPKDEISKETLATLKAIGAELPEEIGKDTPKKGKEKAKGKKKSGDAKYEDRLVSAAEDLNSLEGLVDEIETEDQDTKDLEVEIKNAGEVVGEDDELQDDTWAILYQLEVGPRYAADQKASKKKKGKGKTKTKEEPKKGKGKEKAPAKSKEKKEKKPSNKAKACELWDGGKGITDAAKLSKKLKGAVQESTLKSWLASWAKGNRLPAGF